jgi:hypothetical protein
VVLGGGPPPHVKDDMLPNTMTISAYTIKLIHATN